MNFKRFFSIGLMFTSFVSLALPANAQIAAERAVEKEREIAELSVEEEITSIETAEWSDSDDIREGFLKGCVGDEPLDTALLNSALSETKKNYCQCAFDEYAKRYTPYQFLQINTLASRIGEDGPLLVNLMMGREMRSCAEKTGFELQ